MVGGTGALCIGSMICLKMANNPIQDGNNKGESLFTYCQREKTILIYIYILYIAYLLCTCTCLRIGLIFLLLLTT